MPHLFRIISVLLLTSVFAITSAQEPTQINPTEVSGVISWVWSHDGQMLVIGTVADIRIYRTGELEPLIIPGQNIVRSLAIRQDNQLVASVDDTGVLQIWDTTTGRSTAAWDEHLGTISSVAFVEETEQLVFYHTERVSEPVYNIHLWNYNTSADLVSFPAMTYGREETSMTVNQDGSLVATSVRMPMNGGVLLVKLFIRNPVTQAVVFDAGIHAYVRRYLFSPTDPNLIVVLDTGGGVHFWNIREQVELFALTAPADQITSAAFSPDGQVMATSGPDQTVQTWRVGDGALLEVFPNQPFPVEALRILEDGTIAALGNTAIQPVIWNIREGNSIASFELNIISLPVYNAPTATAPPTPVWPTIPVVDDDVSDNPRIQVNNLKWSSDGRFLAISAFNGLWVYQMDGGAPQLLWKTHVQLFFDLTFNPSGTWLAAGTADPWHQIGGSVYVWEAATGQPITAFHANISSINTLLVSPDERWLVTGGGYRYGDYRVRFWDTSTWQDIPTLERNGRGPISSTAFSADQHYFAYGSNYGPVHLIDLHTNTVLASIYCDSAYQIDFDLASDQILLKFPPHSLEIWEMRFEPEFHLVRQSQGPIPITEQAALLPDETIIGYASERFATFGPENQLRIRNFETGEIEAEITADNRRFTGAAFHPNGSTIALITNESLSNDDRAEQQVASWELGETQPVFLNLD